MTHHAHENSPAPVAAGTGENEKPGEDISVNDIAAQTTDSTSPAPAEENPGHRTWHIVAETTDDGRPHGLCGWMASPSRPSLRTADMGTDTAIPRHCPACQVIADMQDAAARRRQRAEEITQLVLAHLDEFEEES